MRTAVRWTVLGVLGLAACGGSDSTTPPPPTSSVASVDVTPGSSTMNVLATVQLTATPRDAQGAALSGIAISWASSAVSVATVSSSGFVTAVAVGTATITATAQGKQGHATITVTSGDYGPVVARLDIGAAGGTVGTTDIGVTIPAGALTSTRTITLSRDTVSPAAYQGNSASAIYLIDGLPAGVTVQTRVRIRYAGTNTGIAAVGLLRPAIEDADSAPDVMGLTLFEAADSSGYLVATVPLTGRTNWAGTAGILPGIRTGGPLFDLDPRELRAEAELTGLINLSRATAVLGRYEIWGFAGGADLQAKLDKTAGLLASAHSTLVGLGYDLSFRAGSPVQVFVMPLPSGNGVFSLPGAWPKDIQQSYIRYEKNFTDDPAYPGTVIHELFHMVKSNMLSVDTWAHWNAKNWLDEATSTWIAEKHPAVAQPFMNPTALSWRDSLFTGLSSGMVAQSGYGKAPMIKYVAKRWGDNQVKQILDLVHGGMTPISGFLAGIPESPKLWWPDLLTQHLAGTLYPWTTPNLVPKHRYNITVEVGKGAYVTDELPPLGVEGEVLRRDTAMFGPDFKMPIYLDPAAHGLATLLAYQMNPGNAYYRPLAAGDTVLIPGNLLQHTDSLLLLVTPIAPVAPYNTVYSIPFYVDLRVPEGDWYFPTPTNLASTIAFSCDQPGNTVTMDVGSNAASVWSLLAGAGTFKRSGTGAGSSETHTWAPTPAYADSLAKYRITLTSTMVTGTSRDTIHLQAHLKIDLTPTAGLRRAGSAGIPWWWLIVPVGALPFALRRRTRLAGSLVAGLGLLVLAGCVIGQINFAIDETVEYTITRMRFTANPDQPTAPLMQLYAASGKTTMTSYRSEYWSYLTDGTGTKTDSTKVTCTGSGQATYTADGTEYADGVTPPAAAPLASTVSQILGRAPAALPAYLKLQGH